MSARGETLGTSLDPKSNSINFLRIVLAVAVLVSHCYALGGFGDSKRIVGGDAFFNGVSLGSIAVFCFFGISGYLITKSVMGQRTRTYLWRRVLRIFPGFWIALALTAFLFTWLAWLHQHRSLHGYLAQHPGPVSYVTSNFFLDMRQTTIDHLIANGSLWTLFYEFICYLAILVLSLAGALRNRWWALAITVALVATNVVLTYVPWLAATFTPFHFWDLMNEIKFSMVFMVGAVCFLWQDRIPDSVWLAALSSLGFVVTLNLPLDHRLPQFQFAAPDLSSIFFVYPMLWLGAHLPFRRIGVRNDYSYGLYIYAFPVTVLMAVLGWNRWGVVAFTALCLLGTVPFAVASWWLVERHCISLGLRMAGRLQPAELTSDHAGDAPKQQKAISLSERKL